MDPKKTIINGREYELIPAEVVDVNFSGKDNEKLYSVKCRLVGAHGSQASVSLIQARALDANIKNIPIAGEVVMLVKGPTAYNSYVGTGQEYYYTNPISIQSSIHHNGLPGLTETLEKNKDTKKENLQNSQDGIPAKTSRIKGLETTIDPYFAERLDVRPIQPFSGDIILEGRWGQSIRFGSTIDERREYPVKPYWKSGLGDIGNPILIISNGTNLDGEKKYNEFIIENPDTDDSSMWMTSGQSVRFTPASTYTPSVTDKQVDLFKKNDFGGNQVIIASDRIVFNARKQELIGFSKEGIGFSSEKAISLDAKQVVEMESKRIHLGLNAKSPVLLGDRTMDWLNELCTIISKFLISTTQLTVPTGVGPSGVPINLSSFADLNGKIKGLQQKIEKLQSQLAFVNEFSNGPTEEAIADEEKREQRQEKRDAGEEPPREASDMNESALSERRTQTGTQWQGVALWDPNTGEVYGAKSKDALSWFYQKEWDKFANNLGEFEADDIVNTGIKVLGKDIQANQQDGGTTFNTQFMKDLTSGDITEDDLERMRDEYDNPNSSNREGSDVIPIGDD